MAGQHDIAREAGLKDENVQAVAQAIIETLRKGGPKEKVFIKGFGTFAIKTQAERTIKSPQIPGGESHVPARQVLKFKASPQLKDILNAATKGKGTGTAKATKAATNGKAAATKTATATAPAKATKAPAKAATAAKKVTPKKAPEADTDAETPAAETA